MHKTSLNINKKLYLKLAAASKKFNVSKKYLIIRIFHYCHENLNFNKQITGCLTGYQKKMPGDKWKCLRIDFNDTQCDIYLLYRNMFRISLSKLLAVGFFLFFDQIIEELSGKSDTEEAAKEIMISYTELKQKYKYMFKDVFKYFNLPSEKKT